MPSYLQELILAFLYPLREYLRKVSSCQISLNYPVVFEWVCLKRFQELFDENSQGCPHKVLPDFFTEKQQFRMCTEVQFAKHTWPIPKITDRWSFLVAKIENVRWDEYRLNLKPRLKSASSDALMITKIQTKNLTVGLAVRIYTGGTFGETELKDELELFDRMFDTSESDNRLNVLIVCSTNYSAGLKTEFEATDVEGQKIVSNSAGHSIDGFHNIHEIILLNLSTPEQRAKFFAIQDEAHQKALENIIEKAQVQVDNKK